jgi:hypothetical protein
MALRWKLIFTMTLVLGFIFPSYAEARTNRTKTTFRQTTTKTTTTSRRKISKTDSRKTISRKQISRHVVATKVESKRHKQRIAKTTTRIKTRVVATKKRSTKKNATQVARSYYWTVPMVTTPLNPALSARMNANFQRGLAGRYSPQDLVRASVFTYSPLRGGIRPRSEVVSNLIIHSTETARPADAVTVVKSWNHGLKHPGTQYIVDRDGTIHQTVDPRYATVHVNEKRTLGGVTNDNSIGIEIVRSGKQKYTATQLASVVRLVDYIKDRYPIRHVWGHGQIQPSTRTDPVAFNWTLFSRNLAAINSATMQTAYKQPIRQEQG